MGFGTFIMMKAKHDKMKCLFKLYPFNLNLNHKEILTPMWRLNQNFLIVAKEKMFVALATVSVAISSPDYGNERSSSIEFYLRRLTRSVNRYQPHDNVHSWTCNPVSIYKADFNLLPRTALN